MGVHNFFERVLFVNYQCQGRWFSSITMKGLFMNILFPIFLIIGHLLFIWTAAQYLYCGAEGISAISVMRLVLACIFCFSGLYIFHRQKMISPELPVKIYTIYTIARITIALVFAMIPIGIEIADQIMESIKRKYNILKFDVSTLLESLFEILCVFVLVEGIFSIPWILQHIGLF